VPPKRSSLLAVALKTSWCSDAITRNLPPDNPGDPADCFCIRFNNDNSMVAAGCGDGIVRVYRSEGGALVTSLYDAALSLPTTCLRFRPGGNTTQSKGVLLEANSDGTIKHWHVPSAKCIHTVTEANNQVYALDYDVTGAFLRWSRTACIPPPLSNANTFSDKST